MLVTLLYKHSYIWAYSFKHSFTVDILEKQEWNWIVASLIQAISGLYSYIEVTSSWVLDIQEV